MPEYGVDTSNTFALLQEKEDGPDKKEAPKKDAPVRKKVEKKDKQKHGAQQPAPKKTGGATAETSKPKKHEGFDRRPGPGPQRKPDKRTGGGKWDKEVNTALDDEVYANKEAAGDVTPNPTSTDATDSKDGKEKKNQQKRSHFLLMIFWSRRKLGVPKMMIWNLELQESMVILE